MTANLDQPGSQEYIKGAIDYIQRQKERVNFASVTLIQVTLNALSIKATTLNDLDILSSSQVERMRRSFTDSLLLQLSSLLKSGGKLSSNNESGNGLELLSTIDALSTLSVDGAKLAKSLDDAKLSIASLAETDLELAARLETFITVLSHNADGDFFDAEMKGDTSTIYGRQGILQKAAALTAGKCEQEKLQLLKSTFGENFVGLAQLDKLLAASHIISSCKGLLILPLLPSQLTISSHSTVRGSAGREIF